jgi:hypothetical protein
MTASMILALISLGLVLFGALKRRKGFLIAAIVTSTLILVPVLTAYIPKSHATAKLFRIDGMETGYFVSALGAIMLISGCITSLMKESASSKVKEETK